ncbi:hypothetical protein BJV82DRAFT_513660 [Fennellomyces sp. T-0311]|nr:hypothetical protein BJV82DRAFT_513660 [Fennellomyces sp. T-0311]
MFGLLVSASPVAETVPECQTKACANAAETIKDYVDFNADPCEDFFEYSCGSWLEAHPSLPENKDRIGTLATINDENRDVLREIMEKTYDDFFKSISWGGNDFHLQDQMEIDKENFKKVQTYYDTCMDLSKLDALGPAPVYPLIAKGLPGKLDAASITAAILELENQGLEPFIQFIIEADDKNPDVYAIKLSQPDLTLPKELYEKPDMLQALRTAFAALLDAVLGDHGSSSVPLAQKAQEAGLKLLSKDEIGAAVERVINLEKHLASLLVNQDQLHDPMNLYHPTALTDLKTKYPFVDWQKIFEFFAPSSVPNYAIVQTPAFFADLSAWLLPIYSGTADNAETLQAFKDYATVHTIIKWVHALDTNTQQTWRSTSAPFTGRSEKLNPRHETCISVIDEDIGELLGRYYVMRKFGGEKERAQVDKVVTRVQEMLLNILGSSDIFDPKTRQAAIEKVNKIKHKVAYSTVSPDDRSPASLKQYYQAMTLTPDSLIANELSAQKWKLERINSKMASPVDKDEWFMTPSTVNAYYNPTTNEIALPAGILQSPVYANDVPDYLNYGAMGFLVGHELTHGFDSSGRQYDGDGKLNDWWTNKTAQSFKDKAQCFVNQYNSFTVEGSNGEVVNVNGQLTLTENLADNGGFLTTYRAWSGGPTLTGEKPQDEALPGIELTPEQLFFVNYGTLWCGAVRPEQEVRWALTDEHSPAKYRVNGVLQNSAEFANAFKCPQGSPMNPQKKCTLW